MSNQNSWNKGWQDAFSGRSQANMANQNWQARQNYEAAYKFQQQQQQQQQ
jgi:hypothetical protein